MFILETMFVLITPVTILVLVFLETVLVLTMTLETYPVLTLIDSRNGLCVEGDVQRDDETFLCVRKDEVTFLDVQTDGVTLPVPVSSSRFSLGSAVVVGPRENVCSDMKLETDGGSDDSTPAPLAKSAEMKRLVVIVVANGTLNRIAYKTVRKRMQIEARRQKEPMRELSQRWYLTVFSIR